MISSPRWRRNVIIYGSFCPPREGKKRGFQETTRNLRYRYDRFESHGKHIGHGFVGSFREANKTTKYIHPVFWVWELKWVESYAEISTPHKATAPPFFSCLASIYPFSLLLLILDNGSGMAGPDLKVIESQHIDIIVTAIRNYKKWPRPPSICASDAFSLVRDLSQGLENEGEVV